MLSYDNSGGMGRVPMDGRHFQSDGGGLKYFPFWLDSVGFIRLGPFLGNELGLAWFI